MKSKLLIILLMSASFISAQHFKKLGTGLNNKEFYHQQTINYNLLCTGDDGLVYGILYDTVSSGFLLGQEYSQVRIRVFNGISWLNSSPIRLFSRYSIDAPRVLDIKYYDGAVYIAGSFDSSSNHLGAGLLKWSNRQWSKAGIDLMQSFPDYFEVNKLHVYKDGLLISGNFDSIPGERVNGLMLLENQVWKSIGNTGQKGFQNLSGTSNVFFHGGDSLYVYNKNRIKPDSIEIGGKLLKKIGVLRNGLTEQLPEPDDYIAAVTEYDSKPVLISSSPLIYINSIRILENNVWQRKQIPDKDSFYATNYLGSLKRQGSLYLFFQKPGFGIKVYIYNQSTFKKISEFKVADNYLNLEFNTRDENALISGNFFYVKKDNVYSDSFYKVCELDFNPSSAVRVICYHDKNGNKLRENDEPLLNDMRVREKHSGYVQASDGNGNTVFELPVNQSYSFSAGSDNGFICDDEISLIETKDSVYLIEMAFKPKLIKDASVYLYSTTANRAKLGFECRYIIEILNSSKEDQTIPVRLDHSAKAHQFKFRNFTPDQISGNHFTLNVSVPAHGKVFKEFSCVYAPDSFNLGDKVFLIADLALNDDVVKNNKDTLVQTAVSAYDPNIKIPYPSSVVSNQDFIKYVIYFENLGNDTATNVTVVDTFISKLSLASITMGGCSHSYSYSFGPSWIIWHFNDINLPPTKHNSEKSKGFVTFRSYMNDDAKIGDTIFNSAAIFFDYQKPVITNNSQVVFVKDNSLDEVIDEQFFIYPNPAQGRFRLSHSLVGELRLMDISGRQIDVLKSDDDGEFVINESIAAGTYFIFWEEKGQSIRKKIIVLR